MDEAQPEEGLAAPASIWTVSIPSKTRIGQRR